VREKTVGKRIEMMKSNSTNPPTQPQAAADELKRGYRNAERLLMLIVVHSDNFLTLICYCFIILLNPTL
jgi:hypothetical protein